MKAPLPACIRVLVVDDHTMVRRGLATFLKVFDDLELVGEAGGGKEAVDLCKQKQPDVVLMDMSMPDMDGAAITHAIRQQRAIVERFERQLVQRGRRVDEYQPARAFHDIRNH